jgi:hypothetical protein
MKKNHQRSLDRRRSRRVEPVQIDEITVEGFEALTAKTAAPGL